MQSFAALGLTAGAAAFFAATAAACFLPYLLIINESKVRAVTVLGAGLLLGAALQTIIPEGFEAYFELADGSQHTPHAAWPAGCALLAGFLLMLALDGLQPRCAAAGSCAPQVLLANGEGRADEDRDSDAESLARVAWLAAKGTRSSPGSVALGLVVHAAADGLSIGAATASNNVRLQAVVVLAMLLHKAPVAFGLATYFIKVKLPFHTVRSWLLLFAAATPVTMLLTYAALAAISGPDMGTPVALCMLFSGGTVVYAAAIHILPEVVFNGTEPPSVGNFVLLAAGAMVPLGIELLPGHKH